MSRIKLTIAYDGAPFEGWQSQPGGNTVQDHLERAIAEVAGDAIRVSGSGRTDTGVHALGQVAHFDPPEGSRMDAGAWLRALNTKLPAAVRVLDAEGVAGDFHARFSATAKTYQYQIDTAPVLHPLRLIVVTGVAIIAAEQSSCSPARATFMRKDLRPWWLKKLYLRFRHWYAE